MQVDNSTAAKLKPSSDLVKPEIRVGNYHLDPTDWEPIPADEVAELRIFLRDATPFLPAALQAIKLFQSHLESTKHLERQQAHYAFTPLIQLTRSIRDAQYHLRFTWDGVVFLDREEEVMVPSSSGKGISYSGVNISQTVGELHKAELEEKD